MKFRRKSQTIERLKDAAAKGFLLFVCGLLCLWMISGARAAMPNRIESIRGETSSTGAYQIIFALAAAPKESDVQVKFDRNFIQFSLGGVSAFPARTVTLSQKPFERVFTYQYQPDQARARILLSQIAAPLQNASQWRLEGKNIIFEWKAPSSDVLAVSSAAPKRESIDRAPTVSPKLENREASASGNVELKDPAEEKARQELLTGGAAGPAPTAPAAVKDKEQLPVFTEKQKTVEGAPLAKEKASGAGTKIFASLLLVIGIIGAVAAGFRRFVLGKGASFGGSGRTIEVVSQKGLGPKRSIALVRVLDQYMVVGLAGDNINLLSNLGNDPKIEKLLEQSGGTISFADTFATAVRPNVPVESHDGAPKKSTVSVRDLIKKRVEGFKPL